MLSRDCAGNLSSAKGARNQVGIGLSYRPASLCSLATQFQTRFLESIPRPTAGLKIQTLVKSSEAQFIVPYWGDKIDYSIGLSGYIGWRAGSTTPCHSRRYPPVRDYEFGFCISRRDAASTDEGQESRLCL